MAVPGVVVKNHGPFAWGRTPAGAVYNAVVLDKVAEMAYNTMTLNQDQTCSSVSARQALFP